jgi:uncharacterized membrane protein
MFGYDVARLHAALNDFPTALLVAAVAFDLLGALFKRDALKAAGFWSLIGGVVGALGAAGSGLLAEARLEVPETARGVLASHETMAWVVLVLFALLALWRIVRRNLLHQTEFAITTTAAVIGVALMIVGARMGGRLVFDHGVGTSTSQLEAILLERRALARPPAPAPADTGTNAAPAASATPGR